MFANIQNTSLQSLYIILKPQGVITEKLIHPNEIITIEQTAISEQVLNLQKRKMLKVVYK
jgi:hypothetical protein